MFLQGLVLWSRYPQSSAIRIMVESTGTLRLESPGRSDMDANQSLTCSTVIPSTVICPKAGRMRLSMTSRLVSNVFGFQWRA